MMQLLFTMMILKLQKKNIEKQGGVFNMDEWLNEEEQYKENLSIGEIHRIRDPKLREIRQKHWNYRHKIFIDEARISDQELVKLSNQDWELERKEMEEYKERKQ